MPHLLRLSLCAWLTLSATASAADLFVLQSPAFAGNDMMDAKFFGNGKQTPNRSGQNNSPPLVWRNASPQTKSLPPGLIRETLFKKLSGYPLAAADSSRNLDSEPAPQ